MESILSFLDVTNKRFASQLNKKLPEKNLQTPDI